MSNTIITTHEIKNNADLLDDEKHYYYSKKAIFTRSSFGATGSLSNYLLKLNGIYTDIYSNIENLSNFLKEYADDVDGLENQISNKSGFIKAEIPRSIVSKTKNTIKTHIIDDSNVFEVMEYAPGEYKRNKAYYAEVDPVKRFFATTAISGLALTEGIINVGEMITDGLGTAASGVCTIFGATDMAESLMNDVKRDKSGEWYYREVNKYGLDKYGNPDGAVAGGARMTGNITGMVGVTIATMGAGSAIGGSLASTGAVSASTGATISTGSTIFLSGTTGALRDAGIEAEQAMQRGASVDEAQIVARNAAAIGFITDSIAGKINTKALSATGVGQVIGYGVASFGVRSSDPLLNEISHTAIYDHDENLNFFENFMQNAKNYNLGLQMGIAGTAGSVSTVFAGLKGLRTNNKTEIVNNILDNSNIKELETNAKDLDSIGNKTNNKTLNDSIEKTLDNNSFNENFVNKAVIEEDSILKQEIIFKNNKTINDFNSFIALNKISQISYIKNASILELNNILDNIKNLDDEVLSILKSKIIENQDPIFKGKIFERYRNIDSFVINEPSILPSLNNDSLISLLINNKTNQLLLNELYTRIDNGNNVFARNYFLIERWGVEFQDSNIVFSAISEEYQTKIRNMILADFQNLPQELKEISRNGRNVFDQASLARVFNTGHLDETGLNFLRKLFLENPNVIKDMNFDLLNSKYINDLGEDFIKSIINNQEMSGKIINLSNTSPNLYNTYVKLLSNWKNDDTLFTFYPKAIEVLDFMYTNKSILTNINEKILVNDSFLDYVLYTQNTKQNITKIDISFTPDFIKRFGEICDEKFNRIFNTRKTFIEDGNTVDLFIDDLKEMYYTKYFFQNQNEIRRFLTKYATSLDEIRNYDFEAVSIIEYLKYIDEIKDRTVLKELYDTNKIRITPEEFLHLDDRLRKAYALTYQDSLSKTDSYIKTKITTGNNEVVLFNNIPINIVDLDNDFSLIVRSSDSGLVSEEIPLRNNSYIETWNSPNAGGNHILAASYITQSNIGACPVNNKGVLYGFGTIDESKITMMRTSDLNSHINLVGYGSGENQIFVSASEMSSYTRRIYNEIALEKKGTTPDYVIIYNDSSEQLVKNAYQAASEWNIPVLRIDKNKLAIEQSTKINELMTEFKQTKNIDTLNEALDLYESNSSGYKLNSFVKDNNVDKTANINNQTIYDLGLFDSVKMEDDIMDYIHELSQIPNNQKQVNELIELFKNIQAKYDLANDSSNKLLANTKSNLELKTLIEMLEEIRK